MWHGISCVNNSTASFTWHWLSRFELQYNLFTCSWIYVQGNKCVVQHFFLQIVTAPPQIIIKFHFCILPSLRVQTCLHKYVVFSDMREHSSPQSILQSQYLVQGEQGLGRTVLFSSGSHHTQSTVSLLGERSRFTKLGLLKRRR